MLALPMRGVCTLPAGHAGGMSLQRCSPVLDASRLESSAQHDSVVHFPPFRHGAGVRRVSRDVRSLRHSEPRFSEAKNPEQESSCILYPESNLKPRTSNHASTIEHWPPVPRFWMLRAWEAALSMTVLASAISALRTRGSRSDLTTIARPFKVGIPIIRIITPVA